MKLTMLTDCCRHRSTPPTRRRSMLSYHPRSCSLQTSRMLSMARALGLVAPPTQSTWALDQASPFRDPSAPNAHHPSGCVSRKKTSPSCSPSKFADQRIQICAMDAHLRINLPVRHLQRHMLPSAWGEPD